MNTLLYTRNKSMDQNQLKVVSFQFVADRDMIAHETSQIQHLISKKVIPQEFLQYNRMLSEHLDSQRKRTNNVSAKQLDVDKGISDAERIQLINNSFKNKAQLILKVPAATNLTQKQIKSILEHQKEHN